MTHYIEGTDGNYIPDPREEVLVSDWFAETHTHDYHGVDFIWGSYWECDCGHRPTEDEWNAWAETRDAAGELGTTEDDYTGDATVWPPLAAPEHTAQGFVIVAATFGFLMGSSAGFLVAILVGAL